jgi:hypothetical protein
MTLTGRAIMSEARRMWDAHGARATEVAHEMIDALMAIGDEERADEWRQIARSIEDLRRDEPST